MNHSFAPAGMDLATAENITEVLQGRLADLADLSMTLKHVHWNVVGFGFIATHELMDEQAAVVNALIDEVAERITTMGAIAGGLPTQVIANRSSDDDYALGRGPVMAHLGALDKVYERVVAAHREALDEIGEDDLVTQDLLIGQIAKLDLNHWFIRAHLADTDGRLATEGTDSELDAAATSAALLQPGGEFDRDVEAEESELVPLT